MVKISKGIWQMRILSTFVALALSVSAALAGDLGPLPAGTPAGVKQAQAGDNTILLSVLAAGAVGFIGFVLSSGGNTTLPPKLVPSTVTTG
jgi:hypothetical protein